MWTWFRRLYEDAAAGRLGPAGSPLFRGVVELIHVLVVLVRELIRDRLHVRAAMLSYWTAVAIVPILVLGFALTGPLGLAATTSGAVRAVLYDSMLADSVEEVGSALDTLLVGANIGTLGIFGVVGIMLIGAQLYFNAELAYNDIFQTRVKRSWLLRFVLFYAGITLGPLLIATGFVLSARLGATASDARLLGRVLPVLITATALVSAIRLLPCTPVSWRAALTGGLVSAIAFEAAKAGFGEYTEMLGTKDNLARIYGSVAFLPVFLIWTYTLWLIVLFGVEVAWLVQNHGALVDSQRRRAVDPLSGDRQADGFFALNVLAVVVERWMGDEGAPTKEAVVALTGAEPRHVQRALEVLEESGFLLESEDGRYSPARPPETVPASEVLRAWRTRAAPAIQGPAGSAVHTALSAVDHALLGNVDRLVRRRRTP
jgi:membrane protein